MTAATFIHEGITYSVDNPPDLIALGNTPEINAEILRNCGRAIWREAIESTWVGKEGQIRINLQDADLRGLDLGGYCLAYADLSRTNLQGAILTGAELDNAQMQHADLRNTVMHDASLSDADARYALFAGADLASAKFDDADLRHTVMDSADLSRANLTHAKLCHASLKGAHFWQANLRNTDFRGADLQGASLKDVDLSSASLAAANFRDVDLKHANLFASDFFDGEMMTGVHYGSALEQHEGHKIIMIENSNGLGLKAGCWSFNSLKGAFNEAIVIGRWKDMRSVIIGLSQGGMRAKGWDGLRTALSIVYGLQQCHKQHPDSFAKVLASAQGSKAVQRFFGQPVMRPLAA